MNWVKTSVGGAGGIGVCGVLGIVFVVLKLLNVITWSWLWVTAPFWIPLIIGLLIFAIVIIVQLIIAHKY